VPALFSVNYNAERLETECSSTAKYSWQKITNLLGKNRGGYFHLRASYAIRHSNAYHVTLTSENMTSFVLETEHIGVTDDPG
jgi:hypothetical protein